MASHIAHEYRPEYIQERTGLVNAIGVEAQQGVRPVIDAILIDNQNTALCEQAVSYFAPEGDDEKPRIGFSVIDTSYVPPLGVIELVAFDKLHTHYTTAGNLDGGRVFGNDKSLYAALNFRKHAGSKIDVAPAITFVMDIDENGRFNVIGAERTFVNKQPQPIGRDKPAAESSNPTIQAINAIRPDLTTPGNIDAVLAAASNEWAIDKLGQASIPVFGEPPTFHTPLREWSSFKNIQLLSAVVFDGKLPLYTSKQVALIDDIVSGKVIDYDKTALEPVVGVYSLVRLLENPGSSLSSRERNELYDLLDLADNNKDSRYVGFVVIAGALAAENGLLDLKGKTAQEVSPLDLSDMLTGLVQKSMSKVEATADTQRAVARTLFGALRHKARSAAEFNSDDRLFIQRAAAAVVNVNGLRVGPPNRSNNTKISRR